MRGRAVLLLATALAASAGALARPGDPVEVTAKHYDDWQAGRCAEVWDSFSRRMKRYITEEERRRVLGRSGKPAEEKPEEHRCGRNRSHKRLEVNLVQVQGERATVVVKMRGRVPQSRYGLIDPMKEWTEQVLLIREDGVWKIDGPRPHEEKRAGDGMREADVRVTLHPPNEVNGHRVLEALAVSYLPRASLVAALTDPKDALALLPSFKSIELLEWNGKVGRARLAFAQPSPPIPVTLRLSGEPNFPNARFTSFFWDVEQEFKAPVYMRGEWHLGVDAGEATLVKLTIVLDPRHWPGSERLFSADRMVDALLGLEKAALAPSR